jgi:maltose O-acetyltransferase
MSIYRKIQEKFRLFCWRRFSRSEVTLEREVRCQVPLRSDCRGKIHIGRGVSLGFRRAPMMGNGEILLQPRSSDALISIGDECAFSNNVSIIATRLVRIGNRCLIGDQVMIVDSDFHGIHPDARAEPSPSLPVSIGNNVWLGSRVMVLKGVTIGDHAVVAAGAVVTRDIPANTLSAGVPAKIIRYIA